MATTPSFSEKEALILEAYLRLAKEQGIADITLQKVAEEAGVAFGTVHYHFGGKKRSLEAAAVVYVGTNAQNFTQERLEKHPVSATGSRVEAYVEATFEWVKTRPVYASFWIYYYYLTSINSQYRQLNASFLERARDRVASLIYESVGRGEMPAIANPTEAALSIHTLVLGGIFIAICDPKPAALDEQLAATLRSVRAILA